MLDTNIKTQLAAYLEKLQQPIELVATPDGSDASRRMRELLADIAALSPEVSVREAGQAERRPSFSVGRPGEAPRIHFAGLPMGHEFTSLILALLQSGGHPPKIDATLVEQIVDQFPDVVVLAHPECSPEVVAASDYSGSTWAMIRYVQETKAPRYLLLTECSMGDNIVAENPA